MAMDSVACNDGSSNGVEDNSPSHKQRGKRLAVVAPLLLLVGSVVIISLLLKGKVELDISSGSVVLKTNIKTTKTYENNKTTIIKTENATVTTAASSSPSSSLSSSSSIAQHSIPQFQGTGVVIFLHVPKTGGSTIRRVFRDGSHEDHCRTKCIYEKNSYTRVEHRSMWNRHVPLIENILNGTTREVFAVELHSPPIFQGPNGIAELEPFLIKWQGMSTTFKIPFLAFTVVREPVSFYISKFLFYHNRNCHDKSWCALNIYQTMDEKDLMDASVPNLQSKFLLGANIVRANTRPLADSDFQAEVDILTRHWALFPTDHLPNLVNLIRQRILQKPALSPEELQRQHFNTQQKWYTATKMTPESISSTTKDYLLSISKLDQQLYRMAHNQTLL